MKYQVIIVEDEYYTLLELKETIPWERLNLKLLCCAQDGLEGERLIKEHSPDIIITDIRLPGQDGLEMLKNSGGENAIILSGHTDFAYTRKAIQIGVFDYLKKPVCDEELEQCLIRLIEKLDNEKKEIDSIQKEKQLFKLVTNVSNLSVDTAIRYINENYQKPITLADIANLVGLSESHLSTIFKTETKLGFLQYLTAVRINKVCLLLEEPRFNISEIASSSGFANPGYFTKIFKRYTGKTPSEYRESLGVNG